MGRSSQSPRPLAFVAVVAGLPAVRSFGIATPSRPPAAVAAPGARDAPSSRPCRGHPLRRQDRGVLHALSSADSSSWKPCAQPRFDEFASRTVGPWSAAATATWEVEEVMRSCGGAVQGIREVPLSSIFATEDEDARTYHNRADGGFVYADDGSYSAGPARWEWNEASADERGHAVSSSTQLLMASLAFPHARRMWLASEMSAAADSVAKCLSDEGNVRQHVSARGLELSRPSRASGHHAGERKEPTPPAIPKIVWEAVQRVRMPSRTQPWSLARAKWETQSLVGAEANGDGSAETEDATLATVNKSPVAPLLSWTYVESVSASQEDLLFGDVVEGEAIRVHMLAACPASKAARSAVRCYDAEGALTSVAFLEGTVSATAD